MKESLTCTTLGKLKAGMHVNLERALKANGRVDGHFVTGHVDAVVTIVKKTSQTNYTELKCKLPKILAKYVVPKGSVCLDGVSLTVGRVSNGSFSTYLIPHTKQETTLGIIKKNDRLNLETDILAKYILNR